MDVLWRSAFAGLVLLGTVLAGLYLTREDFIYFFDASAARPADMPRTRVAQLPAHNGAPALTVWVTEPLPRHPVVVYFMGEAGSLTLHETRLRRLAEAGLGVAAMAYRGGGGQPGTPGEAALLHDARRVYAGLHGLIGAPVKDTGRVIWGYSLGAGIAARLAAEQEELAVVLESAFTSLCDAAPGPLRAVPGCLLLSGSEYDTLSRIEAIDAPLLILHGAADRRVPVAHAERLFAAAAEPKFIETYPGAGHHDLDRFGAHDAAVSFIRVLAGLR